MKKASEKFIEATNNMNECIKTQMFKEINIEDVSPETLALMQSYTKLMKASIEYIAEASKLMDSMDEKLNKLLEGSKGLN